MISADRRHSLRIAHDNGVVKGFNCLGLRYRHRVCERWIASECTLDEVLDNLAEAVFDPELHRRYEQEIAGAFKEQLR